MAPAPGFSGSFQTQLGPFLAFIVGGSVGLFVTLGIRNASTAIGWAALALPLWLLGEQLLASWTLRKPKIEKAEPKTHLEVVEDAAKGVRAKAVRRAA